MPIDLPESEPAQHVWVAVSEDGSTLFVHYRRLSGSHRYSDTEGAIAIEPPAGFEECWVANAGEGTSDYRPLANRDGTTYLVTCVNRLTQESETFRADASSPQLQYLAGAPADPRWMDPTATVIVGQTYDEDTNTHFLSEWSDDTPLITSPPFKASNMGELKAAGGVVYVNQSEAGGHKSPWRWSGAKGFEALPLLAGDDEGQFADCSPDGSIAVGISGPLEEQRAVIWDRHGVRDLRAELEAAGAELAPEPDLGIPGGEFSAFKVWVEDETVRIYGRMSRRNLFVAELPVRP